MCDKHQEKIIAFVENKLSNKEVVHIKNMIIKNPEIIESIYELARLKRFLGKKTSLKKYLDIQKQELLTKSNKRTSSKQL